MFTAVHVAYSVACLSSNLQAVSLNAGPQACLLSQSFEDTIQKAGAGKTSLATWAVLAEEDTSMKLTGNSC